VRKLKKNAIHRRTGILATLLIVVFLSACTTYPADRFLHFTDTGDDVDQSKIIAKTKHAVVELLDHLNLSDSRRTGLERISVEQVARTENVHTSLGKIDRTVVLANGDIDIEHASNSVIVGKGIVRVSFSSNNIVVTASNIDITFDGNDADGGSLLIAKGTIRMSRANGTIASSREGLEISNPQAVIAYNTPSSKKPRWIGSFTAKPLFADDPPTATTVASTPTATTINERKIANDHPRWPDAEVHMVCVHESRSGSVVVEVQKTQKPIILVVCSYNRIVWKIQPHQGAEILQVMASGYHQQRVEGASFPVMTYSYDENSPFFYTSGSKTPTDPYILVRVRELTGKEITSYQGRDSYENRPFVIKAE
jgi:hypothetical protein